LASDHGGHQGRHHGRAQHHSVVQKHHQQKVFLGGHKLEGEAVIVSVASDGSSMVLQPTDSDAVTATVTISSSTVITADEGVTTTTLAAGERVHVVVDSSNVAQLVVIESVNATGDVKGGDDDDQGSGGGHGDGEHHGQVQFEGVIVSVAADGSSMVLQRPNSPGVTATITISSSTVITADEGVTTTTLAAGEQVHVKAQQVNGTFVATRIEIQKPEANGDQNPGGQGDDDDNGQGGTGNPGGPGQGHGDHSGSPSAGDDHGNGGGGSGGV
jgi:hypothetical protein